jgi:uncharacterized protein (DUF952 family)
MMAGDSLRMIYHMTPRLVWESQADQSLYVAPSLETEGFIHCTAEPDMLEQVANRFYREVPGSFIIVYIASERLEADLRWEEADGHLFPHIYGPLNRSAIEAIVPFSRDLDQKFILPPELKAYTG